MPIPIFLYHHIASPPPAGTPSRSNYVTPENFSRQMGLLKRLGFTCLSLAKAMPYIRGEHQNIHRGKIAVLTFDDGFLSVFDAALPVLAHYGFSATCFFVADRVAGYNDWDHHQAHRAPLMGQAEIAQFAAHGHEVGSHTLTHPHLTQLDHVQAQSEILHSKQKLEILTGQPVLSFAYPYGDENSSLRQMVRQAGYLQAVSTIKGRARKNDDIFALPRHSIRRNDMRVHFLLKCLLR